jgi:hypothetical protein
LGHAGSELREVQGVRPDGELVSGGGERDEFAGGPRRAIRVEHPAQAGHVLLHHVGAVLRRVLAPDRVHDAAGRHRTPGIEQQDRQHRPLLGRAEVEFLAVAQRTDLTEELEAQRCHSASRCARPPLEQAFCETAAIPQQAAA